jgi:hypothetical protein
MVTSVIEGYDRTTTSREPRFLIGDAAGARIKDLVAGSGIPFEDRGVSELKAFPANAGSLAVARGRARDSASPICRHRERSPEIIAERSAPGSAPP